MDRLTALRAEHGTEATKAMIEEILYRLHCHGKLPSAANMLFVVGSVPAEEWAVAVERGRANGWKLAP